MHWISSDEELAFAVSVCRPEYHGQHCMTGVSTRKEVFTGVSPVPGARPTQRFLNRKHMRKIELEPWKRTIVLNNPGHFAHGLFHSDGHRGSTVYGHVLRAPSAGTGIRDICSPMNPRTFSGCAARRSISWGGLVLLAAERHICGAARSGGAA